MKRGMNTTKSFIIWIIGLYIGFIWATFFPNAPFQVFATALTAGLGAVIGKRLFQKHNKFNHGQDTEVHED
jgi:dolichol kinase